MNEDFESLTLASVDVQILKELHRLSKESGHEYGRAKSGTWISEVFTSGMTHEVHISQDIFSHQQISLFHSHTNNTIFSRDDFALLLNPSIHRISVVTSDGRIFSATRGDTIDMPSLQEYRSFVESLAFEVDFDLMSHPEFYDWSVERRFYEAVKEQAYRIARHFKWRLEGGAL